MDCVCCKSLGTFTEHYQNWCRRKGYNFNAVYASMGKKRAQGKPYYVYTTAGANKFLCIYYGRVKEYLAALTENEEA